MQLIEMSEDEFLNHRDEHDGICLACGDFNYGQVEPDARRYECATCGEKYVYGIEELLLGGYIQIED